MSLPVKQGCVIEAFKKGEVDVIGHVVNGQKVWEPEKEFDADTHYCGGSPSCCP